MKHNTYIPDSLKDIKLDNLIRFSKVDIKDETQASIKAFDLFCSTPYSIYRVLPITFINETITTLNKVLNETPKQRLTFEMNGEKFGRIPDLSKISGGEYVDLDTFITPLFEGEIKHEDAFRFMATIYRPIKNEVKNLYEIVDYDKEYLAKDYWIKFKEHCPADVYLETVGFFLSLRTELQKATKSYLNQLAAKHPKQASNLQKIGDGLEVCIAMQKVQEEQLKSPAKTIFSLPYLTSVTKQKLENWSANKELTKK